MGEKMFEDVKAGCEGGRIRLTWEWGDESLTGTDIYYRRKESGDGRGTLFTSERQVFRVQGSSHGVAEKALTDERGLYTFTFVGISRSGVCPDVRVENIMLGQPVQISWRMRSARDGLFIEFQGCERELPPGILYVEYRGCRMPLNYPVNDSTKLLVPEHVDGSPYRLCVHEPFDRAYRIRRLQ